MVLGAHVADRPFLIGDAGYFLFFRFLFPRRRLSGSQ